MTPLFWIWFGFWGFVTWYFSKALMIACKKGYPDVEALFLTALLYQLITILYIVYCV